MGDGMLKEEGTHDELMALKGQYAKMFNIQAERYQSPTGFHRDEYDP
jgi:hypothetical protein